MDAGKPEMEAASAVILALCEERGAGKTICPSEAARQLSAEDWREWMPVVKQAALELIARGQIVANQRGETVDLREVRGPYRLRWNG